MNHYILIEYTAHSPPLNEYDFIIQSIKPLNEYYFIIHILKIFIRIIFLIFVFFLLYIFIAQLINIMAFIKMKKKFKNLIFSKTS